MDSLPPNLLDTLTMLPNQTQRTAIRDRAIAQAAIDEAARIAHEIEASALQQAIIDRIPKIISDAVARGESTIDVVVPSHSQAATVAQNVCDHFVDTGDYTFVCNGTTVTISWP
jgi:hypothetical protein